MAIEQAAEAERKAAQDAAEAEGKIATDREKARGQMEEVISTLERRYKLLGMIEQVQAQVEAVRDIRLPGTNREDTEIMQE